MPGFPKWGGCGSRKCCCQALPQRNGTGLSLDKRVSANEPSAASKHLSEERVTCSFSQWEEPSHYTVSMHTQRWAEIQWGSAPQCQIARQVAAAKTMATTHIEIIRLKLYWIASDMRNASFYRNESISLNHLPHMIQFDWLLGTEPGYIHAE